MSTPVLVMTAGSTVIQGLGGAHGERVLGSDAVNRSLTVPLLCSGRRGFDVEGVDQIEGGVTQRQAVDGGPQVDDVALLGAGGVEALEDVVAQMDTEALAAAVAAVQRPGAAALRM